MNTLTLKNFNGLKNNALEMVSGFYTPLFLDESVYL